MITTSLLKETRAKAGLSQKELAEKAGVSNETIVRLEHYASLPRPETLKKLSDVLDVPFEALEKDLVDGQRRTKEQKTAEKVAVTVRWRDDEDRVRGKTLRFRGKKIDEYEHRDVSWSLYDCPGGYRVFIEDFNQNTAELHPQASGGLAEYITYATPEELVEDFPEFGDVVGIYPVEDLD